MNQSKFPVQNANEKTSWNFYSFSQNNFMRLHLIFTSKLDVVYFKLCIMSCIFLANSENEQKDNKISKTIWQSARDIGNPQTISSKQNQHTCFRRRGVSWWNQKKIVQKPPKINWMHDMETVCWFWFQHKLSLEERIKPMNVTTQTIRIIWNHHLRLHQSNQTITQWTKLRISIETNEKWISE